MHLGKEFRLLDGDTLGVGGWVGGVEEILNMLDSGGGGEGEMELPLFVRGDVLEKGLKHC